MEALDLPRRLPMRKLPIAVAVTAAVAVLLPLAVLAAGFGREGGSLDRQGAAWRSTPTTTSSQAWRTIGQLSFVPTAARSYSICAKNGLSVSLAVDLKGAPVLFRVLLDGGPVLEPGPARFVPAPDTRSFGYTFVGHTGTFEGSDLHGLEVQWRSPTGRPVTLARGVATVFFEEGSSC
jgi:hypothetical protein